MTARTSEPSDLRSGLRFGVLGPLVIWSEGEPGGIFPTGQEARLLAALLLDPNRPMLSSQLIEAVWGSSRPKSPGAALHNVIYRLRTTLARAGMPDRVFGMGSGYRLATEPDSLDARRFEEAIRLGDDRPDAATLLRRALGLWRGEMLSGLSHHWNRFAKEAARLNALRKAALERRIEADLAEGAEKDLIPELRGLVAEDPLNENLWGYLMVALFRAGHQGEALRAYRSLRANLVTQLGMEPSPSIQRLESAILNQDSKALANHIS